MNKQLTNLLSGYQDLMDRYGTDDPLVRVMRAEIEKRQVRQEPPVEERRLARTPSGVWNRRPHGVHQLADVH